MKNSGLCKNIYRSTEKGVEWWLYSGKTVADPISGRNFTHFCLLPAIEYDHWDVDVEVEEDQSFDISFKWLFWYFTITRYWGSVYKKRVKE